MGHLSFTSKRLYLFKREIPSDSSMELVLSELKVNDRDIFIKYSDEFIHGFYGWLDPTQYNPSDFVDSKERSALELQLAIVKVYQVQCEILGIDFRQFWQSRAVVGWFDYMVANSRSFHIQRLGREFSQILKAENDGATVDRSKIVTIKHYRALEKHPEYKEALTIINSTFDTINAAARIDPEMSCLDSLQLELHTCQASVLEGTDTSSRIFICPYCKSLEILKSGVKEREHCEDCKKQYDAHRRKEWRLSQKPIFVAAFGGKPRNCKGSKCWEEKGGRRVQVTIDYLCRRCFKDLYT
jgi:hypothetical protein